MEQDPKNILKRLFPHLYKLYQSAKKQYGIKHPVWRADNRYYQTTKRHIDWNEPRDLNEKINWLKFHSDQKYWADLADKYKVRQYVADKGFEEILVPLYGVWYNAQDAIDALDDLPDDFVLKSNNGSGHIILVQQKSGGKASLNKVELKNRLQSWLDERDFGIQDAELHYQYIKNCIIAEALLPNDTVSEYSKSVIDYKIWCFDGKPFGCMVVFDRDIVHGHGYKLDFFDLEWNHRPEYMTDRSPKHILAKPDHWEEMLKIAEALSQGFPQIRVDLYNVDGKIFFGELTLTSQGGYMDYYTDEALKLMGDQIHLDLDQKPNELYR